ncbi:flavodoxin family protein [Streptococcus chenjunshii]|uniref:Flavodoxin family protein n=1 Tax=Streptococcus chenjunshii TaxID=2173853 RepID=A0A372KP28_9STRE|nr:NAD(P)H-dependent oxidoreductase [Streptococcus chenjunshii]AXQ78845.1 flavodoxin family protein [Streptococcus chenjunshii]RFU51606.1 flavodoxin family protein [Streptococcus chenjunshii]RFU53726.1 flavodoxin family protein [Streptococcus chenjunshii]
MQTTVFLFHPHRRESRVNRTLAETVEKIIPVRYLYDLYPDGKIDVAAEQAVLEKTDRIVLQFPMYWYGAPSLVKEWENQVLQYGWAYGSSGNALHGKELVIAITPGATLADYSHTGSAKYTVTELLRPFQATSHLIGTIYKRPFSVDGMQLSDEELSQAAQDYAAYLLEDNLITLGDYE